MKSNTLYQKTKAGAINQWRVFTVNDVLFTEFGQVGGKLQVSVGNVCQPTNVGKANERNAIQQAEFEAQAMITKQLRLKYSETIEAAQDVRIQPMLAQDGKKAKLIFPLDVQRKYDGLRMMRLKNGKLLSRGNKEYDVSHIVDEFNDIPSDLMPEGMLDGELYIHGMPLQQINSLIKRPQADSINIEYHVYDVPCNLTWNERKMLLNKIKSSKYIKIVETYTANSMEELIKLHDQFILEGYEGAIIRLNGQYEFGKRSKSLLKWKSFEDVEFKIIGMTTGEGKMSECPIFHCKNDLNDKEFDVVPMGTMEMRKEMLNPSNIGKMLTVKFIGRTEDQIPKMAVGKAIKENI